jgi:hypothetical protein
LDKSDSNARVFQAKYIVYSFRHHRVSTESDELFPTTQFLMPRSETLNEI